MKSLREKVNFMLDEPLIYELRLYVPERQRSDFVNEILKMALIKKKREVVTSKIMSIRKKHKLKISDEEVRKYRNDGRK